MQIGMFLDVHEWFGLDYFDDNVVAVYLSAAPMIIVGNILFVLGSNIRRKLHESYNNDFTPEEFKANK